MKKVFAVTAAIALLCLGTFAQADVPKPAGHTQVMGQRLPLYELPPKNNVRDVSTWAVDPPPPSAHAVTSSASEGDAPLPSSGQTACTSLRILVLIYTNTAGGTADATRINTLKNELDEARGFFWRNSYLKCRFEISYLTIDTYKDISEFWELSTNSYWLTFWDTDGDGQSVVQDLRNRGVVDNQYSCVFCFYAWGNNGYGAAYGGAMYGVDVGFLGQTAYGAVPLCWTPDSDDLYFTHEMHHAIDSMFDHSGLPQYPNPDQPVLVPGDYGSEHSWYSFILRECGYWLGMASPWATVYTAADADQDGVPDSDANLPLTEATFGSNSSLADTDSDGLDDLGEAMAGILSGSNPNATDTDGDSLSDSLDRYPLYPIDERLPNGTRSVNGSIEPAWHTLASVTKDTFSATCYVNWDTNYLYLAFRYNMWNWTRIEIDAANDGWFHGIDNYEISFTPNDLNNLWSALILDCTGGTQRWRSDILTPSDILYRGGRSGNSYDMEIRIARNTTTSLLPEHGRVLGLMIRFDNISGGGWASPFEEDVFVDLTLAEGSRPTLAGISASSAFNVGPPVSVALAGTGFQAGASVKLTKSGQSDIFPATGVALISSTRITCTLNLVGKALGQWNVVVTNPDAQSATLTNGFTVTAPAPTVTSITPTSGLNTGSVSITDLSGTGFQLGATVKLTKAGQTDIAATSVERVSASKITCTFDLTGKALGQWNVVVTNPDAQSATLTNGFAIAEGVPPVISSVAISPPMAAAGDAVHVAVDATDNVGVTSVRANGTDLAHSVGSSWSGDIVADPALGLHTVTVVARDAADNSATDSTQSYMTAQALFILNRNLVRDVTAGSAGQYLFITCGRVTRLDDDTFELEDGSGTPVWVSATGHGRVTDDFVFARGIWSMTPDPHVLLSSRAHITPPL